MRAVVQRVSSASVTVDGRLAGEIREPGLLVYLGITHSDGPAEVAWMARKVGELRSASCARNARPTWQAAAPAALSQPTYDAFCDALGLLGATVERGEFGADMRVTSTNDGPLTLLLER